MAIVKDSKALALDIIALKTKLNNELLRRCGQNSLYGLGLETNTDTQFTVEPDEDVDILIEHYNKLVNVASYLSSDLSATPITSNEKDLEASDIKEVDDIVTNRSTYAKEYSGASCTSASCSGIMLYQLL